MAIGACRKVGTQTLTASRPSSRRAGPSSRRRRARSRTCAASLARRAVLEAGERDDLGVRVGVVGGEVLLAGPAEADDADAQVGVARGHPCSNQPRGDSGLPGTARGTPGPGAAHCDGVGDHALDVGVVVDRVVLVAGAEVEDPPGAAPKAAAAAEHLAAGERADEDELVGRRDVEVLAVHLVRVDDDRVRDAGGDRVRGVDGPHQLALAVVAPAQAARGAEQALEDLRVVRRVQGEQAHRRRAPRRARARRPRRRPRSCAVWPHQVSTSVSASTASVQPVLGLVAASRCARETRVAQPRGQTRGDRGVHPVGVERAHVLLLALVDVLAPHRHSQSARST